MRTSSYRLLYLISCFLCFMLLASWDAFSQNWELVDVTPGRWDNADLNDVCFVDGQGWAVGEDGVIIHTHNGVRWHDQISGVDIDLYGVYFDSTSEGWVVGNNGTILHTTDGGIFWEQQIFGTDLYDVFFVEGEYGWAVGRRGTILYTENGGRTWDAEIQGQDDLFSVYFRSDTMGWAVGESGTILRWNGTGWMQQVNPSTNLEDLHGVHFTSANDGWIVGDAGLILNTSTGGSTWFFWKDRADAGDLNLRSVYFLENQKSFGWIVGEDGATLRTQNSGGSWWRHNSPSTKNLNAVCAVSANTVWAVGESGSIILSEDSGRSWEIFINPPYGDFFDVSFDVVQNWPNPLPDMKGWIVGEDGVILKITEDGTGWYEYPGPAVSNLYGVYMLDKHNAWAVGGGGAIVRYQDDKDGTGWGLANSPTEEELRGAYFTKINKGWVVGDNGVICHWDGIEWDIQDSNVNRDLYGVAFVSDTQGWIAGELGIVLYTNNGGLTWDTIESGVNDFLQAVYFADSNNGWFAGNNGTILYWHDGEFTEQNSHTSETLYDIDFVSEVVGWVSGGSGLTIGTPDAGDRWDLHPAISVSEPLYGIDFGDVTSGFAVGRNGTVLNYVAIEPIAAVELLSPRDDVILRFPTFTWATNNSMDRTVFIDKDVDVSDRPLFAYVVRNSANSFTPPDLQLLPGVYYWGIKLADGTISTPAALEFTVWPPTEVTLTAPSGYISEASPEFQWVCNNQGLADKDLLSYTLFIDDDGNPFDGIGIPVGGNSSHTLTSADPLSNLPEGKHFWGIQTSLLDSVESNVFTITVDLSPPGGTVEINDGASFTNSLDVTLTLTASDQLSAGAEGGVGVVEMQFSNDGVDWSAPEPFAGTKTWNLLLFGGSSEDGEKTVYARFKDELEHWMTTPATDTIALDTVPPMGTISINDGAVVVGLDDITLSLSASDDKSDMEDGGKMMLSNGVDWSDELPYVTSRGWDFTFLGGNDDEGTKTVYVRYMDAAGNWMQEPISDDVELDTTGPTGTIMINNGESLTDLSLVELTLAASDKSGVQSMKFTNGDSKWSLLEPFNIKRENWDITAEEYGGNSDPGPKTVYVRFVDSVGNESSQAASDDIRLKTAVSVQVELIPPDVEGKVKDDDIVDVKGSSEPGLLEVDMRVLDDAGKSINIDLIGVLYNAETGDIIGSFSVDELTAKTIQFEVAVQDTLGNKANATSNILIVDNDPPGDTSLVINQAPIVNYTTVNLTISATDALEMYISGHVQGHNTWLPYAETLEIELMEGDGVKEIMVKFRDDIGNESSEVSDEITLDNTPPTGTISIDSGAEFTNGFQVTLTLSASDANGVEGYQLSNDNTTWTDESQMTSGELQIDGWDLKADGGDSKEGPKVVYVRYKDRGQNWSESLFDDILVDTTAPTISVEVVEDKQEALEPVTVTAIIKSDRPITEANLHYRRKGPHEYTTIPMTHLSGDYYTAEIPGPEVTLDGVEYYLSATDGRFVATHPTRDAPIAPNSFTVVDRERPVIEHDPVTESAVKSSPEIVAKVTDAVGVKKVTLFHKLSSERSFQEIDMLTGSVLDVYSAFIPEQEQIGVVLYYIEAVDLSDNAKTAPPNGATKPYAISFVDTESPVIVHTGIKDGQEAGNPVEIGATVTDDVIVQQVLLKYKPADKEEFIEEEMTAIEAYYTAEIPGDDVMPGEIVYSITASDGSPQSENAEVSHSFTVVDATPPDIDLTFAPLDVEVFITMLIEVEVIDNVAVSSVILYYKGVQDTAFEPIDMVGVGKKYSAIIPGQGRPGEVKFYVQAEDSQGVSSTEPEKDPQSAPLVIIVEDKSSPEIEYSPLVTVQEAGIPVTIAATVTDNVQIANVLLRYRTAGAVSFELTSMIGPDGDSQYHASIPESAVIPSGVEYYIRAADDSGNEATHPADNPDTLPHSFVVQDTVPPEITYDPSGLATVLITEDIVVTVEATDLVGIRELKVFYAAEGETDFSPLVSENIVGGDKFSVQLPSPSAESRIDYYIQAEDNSGNMVTSPAENPETQPYSTFVEDPFPPLHPTGLTADSAPGGKIILTWKQSDSSDVDRYNIYTDSGSGTVDYSTVYASVSQSSLPDDSATWKSPALGDGVYKFVVRAVDKSGNEETNTNSESAKADSKNPQPATNLVARSRPGGRIQLEWTLSVSTEDAAAYNIYWDNAQLDIDYSRALVRVSDPGVSWLSDRLRDGVIYKFVVRCEDSSGNEEENTDFVSARADATPPEKVTDLVSLTHNVGEWSNQPHVTVEWTPAEDRGTGVVGYSMIWDIFAETLPDDIMDDNKNTDTATVSGSQYFHIRSVDGANNWGEAAHLGPFRVDTESPQAPTNLRASPQADGKITLDWGAPGSADVVRYNIYGDEGSGRGIDYSTPMGTVTGLTWTSAALEDGTTHQFSVRAEDRAFNEETNTKTVSSVADGQPPAISHRSIDGLLEQEIVDVLIEATVTDASKLDSVRLHYRKRGVTSYEETEMTKGANNVYTAEIPASIFSSAGVDYYVSASDEAGNVAKHPVLTIAVGTVLKIPVAPARENEILLGDGSSILLPEGSVATNRDLTITIPKFVPEPQEGLGKHIVTREFSVADGLSKTIRFTLPYSSKQVAGEDESKLAVYLWDSKRWNFLTTVDAQANMATVTTMRLGIFSVMGDYDPPDVTELQPSGYAETDVTFTARMEDNGSGIDPKNITLLMNGQTLDVSTTALKGEELSLALPGPLEAGDYTLELAVRDNLGNEAVATTSFQVVGKLVLENVYCYPNPFQPSGSVNFAYTLTESVDSVIIRIFGMDGKLARKIEGTVSIGENLVPWDCRDEAEEQVLSSVYICYIEVEGPEDTVVETIRIAGWD